MQAQSWYSRGIVQKELLLAKSKKAKELYQPNELNRPLPREVILVVILLRGNELYKLSLLREHH